MKTVVVNWVKDGIVINDFFVETKIVEKAGYELVDSKWLWDRLFELYGEAYQYLPKTKNYCAELKRYVAYLADVDDEPVFYSTNGLEIIARKEINTFRYICKLILKEKGLSDKKNKYYIRGIKMNVLLRNDIDDLNSKEYKKFLECKKAFHLRGMNKNQEIFVKRMTKGKKIIARISSVIDVKEKIKIEILKISSKEKEIKEEILFEESFFTNYHETQFHDFHGFRIYRIIKLFLRDCLKL